MIFKKPIITLFNLVRDKINKGQERSVKAKKNILFSFILKGVSISISIILVPLTINYVNVSQYGVWLTISSIVAWFSFFDIGLTQGLRNKFAEAVAKGDDELARIYISTTYAILTIICGTLWIVFVVLNQFLEWASILKISQDMNSEVSILALIVFSYFCLQFVLRVLTTILTANQQPAMESLISVLGQVLSLLFILVLVKTTSGSLVKLGLALCVSPILILVGASIFFFNRSYKKYRPSFSKIKFSYAKGLFKVGVIFFIIQIAGIVQFQTANIIIARNFTTADVTSYNIVYKYFGIIDMIFAIFVTPFWSASTEAYFKNDIQWIKKGIKKYNQLNFLLFMAGIIMLFFSQDVYNLWLGKNKVSISFNLSLWGFLYFNMAMFVSKYVFFLNGINALRVQFIACIISPFAYVGLAFLLIKYYHLGVYALFIAAIGANFNGLILAPIQYYLVIYKNKKGIWIK
jgi:O-antigen/teichoic acid export membrane protein